eukprot:3518368-Heterocapsa_arctica.AAC.1
MTRKYHKGRGTGILFVTSCISAPQDNSECFAITNEMRQNQVKLNRMKKHSFLLNKGNIFSQEAHALQDKIGNCGAEKIREQQMVVEHMRNDI